MSGSPEIDALISDHLDGVLDHAGRLRLEVWLVNDPAHRRRFVHLAMQHAAMLRLASVMAAKPPTLRTRRILARRHAPAWQAPLAIAAALLAALAAWWLWPEPARSAAVAVATAAAPTAMAPVPVSVPTAPVQPKTQAISGMQPVLVATGQRLPAGAAVASEAEGTARLRWDDGSEVELAPATRGEVIDGIGLRLLRGRLSARIAAQPAERPAIFTTREAEVIVIGTELAVAAGEGESLAEVTHGRVRMRGLADGASVEIGAGECAMVVPGLDLRTRPIGSPFGREHRIAAGAPWPEQDSLQPGDVLALAAGTHAGAWRLSASGTALRPIVLRGAGMDATVLDAADADASGAHHGPRGVLQAEGRHLVIEGLTLRGSRNATANAAGVRLLVGADAVAIRACRIAACDIGVFADVGTGDLLLADCDIAGNGMASLQRSTHNLNLSNRSSTIRGCRIAQAPFGLNVELRGGDHRLVGNRISGGAGGEIALTVGERSDASLTLLGNLVVGSPRADDGNFRRFIAVHRTGAATARLIVRSCTLVAGDTRNRVFDAPGCQVELSASIVAGTDLLADSGTAISGRDNCLPTGASPGGLAGTIIRGDPGFIDPANGDFRLAPGSPCRGAAAVETTATVEPPGLASPACPRAPDRDLGALPARQ